MLDSNSQNDRQNLTGSNCKFNSEKSFQISLKLKKYIYFSKALHSELLTELSSRFSSRNEFFAISEVRILHHFFVIFGNFGKKQFPKFPKFPNIQKTLFPKFPNIFRTFLNFFQSFWRKNRVFWLKNSNFTYFFWNFEIYVHFRIISELFPNLNFQTFFQTFFAKIPRVRKFRFFSTKFPNFNSQTFPKLAKRKVWKIPSNAGPYILALKMNTFSRYFLFHWFGLMFFLNCWLYW